MAEVGILNLKITSDTSEAESGLNRLTDALSRVKEAVQGAQLNNVASQIRRLVKTINEDVNGTTLMKLRMLAESLSKLQGLGDISINLRNSNQLAKAVESVDRALQGIQRVPKDGMGNGFAQADERIQEVNGDLHDMGMTMQELDNIVHNTNWAAQFDPSKLPIEALGMKMDSASQEMYKYGDAVKDSFEIVKSMMPEDIAKKYDEVIGKLQGVSEAKENLAGDNGNVQIFSSIEEAAERLGITVEEVKEKLQSTLHMVYGIPSENVYSSLEEAAQRMGITLEEARRKVVNIQSTLQNGANTNLFDNGTDAANRMDAAADRLQAKIEQIVNTFRDSSPRIKQAIADIYGLDVSIFDRQSVQSMTGIAEGAETAAPAMQTLQSAMDEAKAESEGLNDNLKDVDDELKKKKEDADDACSAFDRLKEGMSNLVPALGALWSRLKSILLRRVITAALRSIWKGLKEGVNNVREYSKAVGTSFAPAMQSASDALFKMQNSIGAALTPLLEALIPILQTIVSWVITAVNWINQLFALLSGKTQWTHAIDASSESLDNVANSAGGASKAVKDLLADWDELNIIQSESGGGGGGGSKKSTPDYASMFEELTDFDEKIKKLVEGIKKEFGSVWNLVKEIGAVILGWRVAAAFAGTIGILGAIVGGVATIDIVFKLSKMFTSNYLETGDIGWMIADILETSLGGFITSRILGQVLSAGAATLGIPLTFFISAGATIIANIEHTDVSALSERSLVSAVVAAIEGGVAGAYMAHLVGGTVGASLVEGAVVSLATFGVAISLKADAAVTADDIAPETIGAKILSIAALGIAGGTVGAMYGSTAAAIGMGMLFAGLPIVTLGVSVGINAINETVDGSGITKSVITKNLIAGGIVGAGLALQAGALAGGYAAMIVGPTGAAITIAALFAIEAIISEQASLVEWGGYEATKEEIEAYVNSKLIKDPPQITIGLIDATLSDVEVSKKNLEKQIEQTMGTFYSVRLGIKEDSIDTIKEDVNSLISTFNETADAEQKSLEVAVSLVPATNKEGENIGDDIAKSSSERWDDLKQIMSDKGAELVQAYSDAYNKELDEKTRQQALDSVEKISNMLIQVATAVANGQAKAKAMNIINMQLTDLSQASLDSLFETFNQQKEELVATLTKAREESAEGLLAQHYAFAELAEYALKESGGDVTNETYKHYKEQADKAMEDYKAYLANLKQDVEDAVNATFVDVDEQGKIGEYLASIIKTGVINKESIGNLEQIKQTGLDYRKQIYKQLFADNGSEVSDAQGTVRMWLQKLISNAYGQNAHTINNAIDLGFLNYGDVIDKAVIDQLADTIGISSATPEVQKAWNDMIASMFKIDPKEQESEAANSAKAAAESATSAAANAAKDTVNKAKHAALSEVTEIQFEEKTKNAKPSEEVQDYYNALERMARETETSDIDLDMSGVTDPIEDSIDLFKEYEKEIEQLKQLLNGGVFDYSEVQSIIDSIGLENFTVIRDKLMNENGVGTSGRTKIPGVTPAGGDFAFAGASSGVRFASGSQNEQGIPETDISGDVQTGVENGSTQQVSLLSQLLNVMNAVADYTRQTAAKEFSVTISPSSDWGFHNQRSGDSASYVTGDIGR